MTALAQHDRSAAGEVEPARPGRAEFGMISLDDRVVARLAAQAALEISDAGAAAPRVADLQRGLGREPGHDPVIQADHSELGAARPGRLDFPGRRLIVLGQCGHRLLRRPDRYGARSKSPSITLATTKPMTALAQ